MEGSQGFSYESLFAKNAPVGVSSTWRRPKYDFAVAYPDPDTLPLEGLADALKTALEREGRDLAYYPWALVCCPCDSWWLKSWPGIAT